jgi:hypothetical protein
VCSCFSLLTSVFPIARVFFRIQLGYSEGWNIYNTTTLVNHQLLYPVRYGWTTVNYPMLSFAVLAVLHHFTHEYLFTARALSLVGLAGSCILVAAIVRILGASRQLSVLAGFFCLSLFATNAGGYFGMDDPQILAQVFFLAGLLLYLWRRNSRLAIAGVALLFVIGGSIKHNPIEFPLAVLIDTALVAPRRALWFSLCGLGLAGAAIALNIHFGGPYFVTQMLTPRSWTPAKTLDCLVTALGPVLIPFLAVLPMAFVLRKDKQRRIISILLVTSLLLGGYFGGGSGVSINALFGALLAIAIMAGLLWERLWKLDRTQIGDRDSGQSRNCGVLNQRCAKWPFVAKTSWLNKPPCLRYAPAYFFAWLIIPWLLVPAIASGFNRNQWDPLRRLSETAAAERRFDYETAMLHNLPGPAICESLLRCYFAGKPYIFDPFNTTRLIQFGKLDPKPMIEGLRQQRYAAVQFDYPVQKERSSERFDPAIVGAIEQSYVPALVNEDGEIYVPRTKPR